MVISHARVIFFMTLHSWWRTFPLVLLHLDDIHDTSIAFFMFVLCYFNMLLVSALTFLLSKFLWPIVFLVIILFFLVQSLVSTQSQSQPLSFVCGFAIGRARKQCCGSRRRVHLETKSFANEYWLQYTSTLSCRNEYWTRVSTTIFGWFGTFERNLSIWFRVDDRIDWSNSLTCKEKKKTELIVGGNFEVIAVRVS